MNGALPGSLNEGYDTSAVNISDHLGHHTNEDGSSASEKESQQEQTKLGSTHSTSGLVLGIGAADESLRSSQHLFSDSRTKVGDEASQYEQTPDERAREERVHKRRLSKFSRAFLVLAVLQGMLLIRFRYSPRRGYNCQGFFRGW